MIGKSQTLSKICKSLNSIKDRDGKIIYAEKQSYSSMKKADKLKFENRLKGLIENDVIVKIKAVIREHLGKWLAPNGNSNNEEKEASTRLDTIALFAHLLISHKKMRDVISLTSPSEISSSSGKEKVNEEKANYYKIKAAFTRTEGLKSVMESTIFQTLDNSQQDKITENLLKSLGVDT